MANELDSHKVRAAMGAALYKQIESNGGMLSFSVADLGIAASKILSVELSDDEKTMTFSIPSGLT